jgi:pimeloyl-ACP methyl ester carboxylesterase
MNIQIVISIAALYLFSGQTMVQSNSILVTDGHIYKTSKITSGLFYAKYATYIPEGFPKLRGILVHQHGCGDACKDDWDGEGNGLEKDLQYQAFAKKWGFAIINPALCQKKDSTIKYPGGIDCLGWSDIENGSEKVFFAGLDSLARMSGHPEFSSLPVLLWGHSGGGHWVLSMLRKHPEKVIAVFAVSPAFTDINDYPESVAGVPVLIRHGGKADYNDDGIRCWSNALRQFHLIRNMGGCAGLALSPKNEHGSGDSRYLAIPFFEAVLAQRLPAEGTTTLRNVDNSKVWLADTATNKIFKLSSFKGDKLKMTWLPDSETAIKWKEFVTTGTVTDDTPPPAPFNVKSAGIYNACIEVTWNADADIESGIAHFNIYKNGILAGRIPSEKDFQTFGYGDEPNEKNLPVMKFTLEGIDSKAKARITITTVNKAGLESVKSKKATFSEK